MSNKTYLKEAGFLKRILQKFKDRRLAKKFPKFVKNDPALKAQLKKVFNAFDRADRELDKTEELAAYINSKYQD